MRCNEGLWSSVSAYVLAGGRSSRMGTDKAFLRIGGVELVDHAVQTLRRCCQRVAILSGPPNAAREAALSRYGRTVADAAGEHNGPLAGLIAALQDAQTPVALLLAVDQPGVSASALELLLAAVQQHGVAASCFVGPDGTEPLPFVVRQDLLPELGAAVGAGRRRLFDTVVQAAHATGREVRGIEVLGISAGTLRLANLNTPADVQTWQQEAEASNQSARRASE